MVPLTGMRDCEVQAMRSGCLSLARSEDGLIMRHRVRSVAYKGKRGCQYNWFSHRRNPDRISTRKL